MLDIMQRIKIGTVAIELPILSPLSKALRFVPKAILPTVLHSNDTNAKEMKNSAASAKASDDANTIFADVAAEAEKGEILDAESVSAEAGVFTIAGTDTTAITLTYAVWCILSRPDLQEKVEKKSPHCQMTTPTSIFWTFPGSTGSSPRLFDSTVPSLPLSLELHLRKAPSWVASQSLVEHSSAHSHTPSTETPNSSLSLSSKSNSTLIDPKRSDTRATQISALSLGQQRSIR
jgi:hypothetical protein